MTGSMILEDSGEKLIELGQHIGATAKKQLFRGIVKTAKKQITGSSDDKEEKGTAKQTSDDQNTGKEYFKQLMGQTQKMTPQQLVQAKQQDQTQAAQKASQIKQHIQRYQQQVQELQAYRAKKAQEMPAYIAGRPGQARTPEDQAKKMAELKKEEEKQKKKKKLLPESIEQLQGSHEKGKFIIG